MAVRTHGGGTEESGWQIRNISESSALSDSRNNNKKNQIAKHYHHRHKSYRQVGSRGCMGLSETPSMG